MNESGELIEWRDERGFGFVQTDKGERLFVHIKAFAPMARRPQIGDQLTFSFGKGRDGRLIVASARIDGLALSAPPPGPTAKRARRSRLLRISAALLLAAALGVAISADKLPDWVLLIYIVMGAASGFAYWSDKDAANDGDWRTPEARLHLLDLAGGIIGGLLAQAVFRHKTAKAGFAGITWLIVCAHLIGLALLAVGVLDLPVI